MEKDKSLLMTGNGKQIKKTDNNADGTMGQARFKGTMKKGTGYPCRGLRAGRNKV